MTATETASIISRRPPWAERVAIGPEAIDYTWTAPTVPASLEFTVDGDIGPCGAPVDITRQDRFHVTEVGVALDEGPERIFLLDTTLDVKNARKLAAAILECCDRIEQAAD